MKEHFEEYQQILNLANKIGNKEISNIVLDNIYEEMLDREIHTYAQASMIVEVVKCKKKVVK
jgi:hypothetical protein